MYSIYNMLYLVYSNDNNKPKKYIIMIITNPGLRMTSVPVGGEDVTGNVYVYIACLLLSLSPAPQPPTILVQHRRHYTIFIIKMLSKQNIEFFSLIENQHRLL